MKTTFIPPLKVARAAEEGLLFHEYYGRGGTRVGLMRARQLSNRKPISVSTIKRMYSFFKRHEQNKKTKPEDGNGKIAWLLWGGDEGFKWVKSVMRRYKDEF